MKEIARLELGYYWPDGRRAYTAVDNEGQRYRGVLDEPDLVGEYLEYLDSLGLEPPIVTGTARVRPDPAAPLSGKKPATPPARGPRRAAKQPAEPRHSRVAVVPIVPIPIGQINYLLATAARAPSMHNTQPWRFGVDGSVVELHADRSRGLHAMDPTGREMLISCGAALFGLRLAVRRLGYPPACSAAALSE